MRSLSIRLLTWLIVAMSVSILHPANARADSGRQLFFDQDFNGNGQRCGTCHREDQGQLLAFGPAFAQDLFLTDPDDPLFTPINSADTFGTDFSRLFSDGTVPIPIRVPNNVTVIPVTAGAQVFSDAQGEFILLHRKTPSILNIALKNELMLDGRHGQDFLGQAVGAADTHFGPNHDPLTLQQQEKLAKFQQKQFSDNSLNDLFQEGIPRALPEAQTPLEEIGKRMLEPGPLGKCAMCHGGPNLDRTNEDNILNAFINTYVAPGAMPPGLAFATNFSGGTAFNFPGTVHDANPVYMFVFNNVDDQGNPAPDEMGQLVRTLFSADPGALLNRDHNGNAHPCRADLSGCFVNNPSPANGFQASAREIFAIPSLWDIGQKIDAGHVFFHHGQAHSLEDVMDVYEELFLVTAFGMEQLHLAFFGESPDFSYLIITPDERAGVIAYLSNRMK
jgi:cytochrome c peroxidase